VAQPSEWQRGYTRFNERQLELLAQRHDSVPAK
jgi:hypothetical protein